MVVNFTVCCSCVCVSVNPFRKSDWVNEQIEIKHDKFHAVYKTRGGNFHWTLLAMMLAPALLCMVQDRTKVGKFLEAWTWERSQWDAAMASRILDLHGMLYMAFAVRKGQEHHHREALMGPGAWRAYIAFQLQLEEGYEVRDDRVWLVDANTGWWEAIVDLWLRGWELSLVESCLPFTVGQFGPWMVWTVNFWIYLVQGLDSKGNPVLAQLNAAATPAAVIARNHISPSIFDTASHQIHLTAGGVQSNRSFCRSLQTKREGIKWIMQSRNETSAVWTEYDVMCDDECGCASMSVMSDWYIDWLVWWQLNHETWSLRWLDPNGSGPTWISLS